MPVCYPGVTVRGGAGGSGAAEEPDEFDPDVTVDSITTLASGGGSANWWGRASIKRRPSDNALVMCFYRASAHNTNDGSLYIRFSNNDGTSWTADNTTLGGIPVSGFPMNPPGGGGLDAGEPWLMVAPSGDLLLHMWRINYGSSMDGSWQSRSTDGGETWSTPTQIDFGGQANDDIVFSTDDDFVLDDVIYAGARVYSGGADGNPSSVILIKSDDDGATWDTVSTIMVSSEGSSAHGGQEVGLEYLGDDTIIAMLRDNEGANSYQRMSDDLGAGWGDLVSVTGTVGIAGRQRVYTKAHLKGEANWWEDPKLIMVGFTHSGTGPRTNKIWLSPDAGETWVATAIDTATDDSGYGDVFYDSTHNQWVVVNYYGSIAAASLKQYNLTITGW